METISFVDEVPFGADVETLEIEQIDDLSADECIRKIGNIERFRKFWLDFYQKKIDEVNRKCDTNVAYQRRKLRAFFDTVPHRGTKTTEAYDLPSGKLSFTFAKRKLNPDRTAIIERMKKNGETEFIKVKTTVDLDWSGYSKRLIMSDEGEVIDRETGEVVSDVVIEMTEPKFDVKMNGGVEE